MVFLVASLLILASTFYCFVSAFGGTFGVHQAIILGFGDYGSEVRSLTCCEFPCTIIGMTLQTWKITHWFLLGFWFCFWHVFFRPQITCLFWIVHAHGTDIFSSSPLTGSEKAFGPEIVRLRDSFIQSRSSGVVKATWLFCLPSNPAMSGGKGGLAPTHTKDDNPAGLYIEDTQL